MTKLYDLADQYVKFNEYVEAALDNGGELTEDDLQMFIDTLEGIQDSLELKCENIVKFIKNIESDIVAFKAEEDKLAKKRKYLENRQKNLKEYMQNVLETNKIEKVNAGLFKVRLQKNNPSVEIVDETKIPKEYRQPQPDKIMSKELLAAIKGGVAIDGAKLAEEKLHIRIS